MKAFFDEADRRGLRIFINTLSMPDWWAQADAGAEVTRAGECIRNIARLYGTRAMRAFQGFLPFLGVQPISTWRRPGGIRS
jgi:hypothetical protein